MLVWSLCERSVRRNFSIYWKANILEYKNCFLSFEFFLAGFRKDAIRFCNQVGVNFTDKKHLLAPFVHESYLLANNGKLSGSFESNEKLAFLGKSRQYLLSELKHIPGFGSNISNTRKSVSPDIQTLRNGLKKHKAQPSFFNQLQSWNTLSSK